MSTPFRDDDATKAVGCALLAAGTLAILASAGICATIARADDGEAARAEEYGEQHHIDAHTGREEGCIIYALDLPCEPIPGAMAAGVVAVATCESRWDPEAVGAAGERGLLQVHPVHRQAMASAGLDYDQESDRIKWAVRLWEGRGWTPWSCGR